MSGSDIPTPELPKNPTPPNPTNIGNISFPPPPPPAAEPGVGVPTPTIILGKVTPASPPGSVISPKEFLEVVDALRQQVKQIGFNESQEQAFEAICASKIRWKLSAARISARFVMVTEVFLSEDLGFSQTITRNEAFPVPE